MSRVTKGRRGGDGFDVREELLILCNAFCLCRRLSAITCHHAVVCVRVYESPLALGSTVPSLSLRSGLVLEALKHRTSHLLLLRRAGI